LQQGVCSKDEQKIIRVAMSTNCVFVEHLLIIDGFIDVTKDLGSGVAQQDSTN
jgi:hypothetical protein